MFILKDEFESGGRTTGLRINIIRNITPEPFLSVDLFYEKGRLNKYGEWAWVVGLDYFRFMDFDWEGNPLPPDETASGVLDELKTKQTVVKLEESIEDALIARDLVDEYVE